jgi:hypothetical protein
MKKNPKVSIIFTARNDDYGKNLINRINASLKVLTFLTEKHKSNFELIIVEYNPVPKKPLLIESITIPSHKYLQIRAVIVPNTFHQQLGNHNKIPVHEYIAKNIGIKRANGDYILCTNPDIIFSDNMIKKLTTEMLDKDSFFRANRTDLKKQYYHENCTATQILNSCRRDSFRVYTPGKVVYLSFVDWLYNLVYLIRNGVLLSIIKGHIKRIISLSDLRFVPLINKFVRSTNETTSDIHEMCAGDFTLMHKGLWTLARGYDETPLSSFHDQYMLFVQNYCYGKKQQLLTDEIFHIDHEYGKKNRPEVEMTKYAKDVVEMKKTKKPYTQNSEDWGYPMEKFKLINL